MGLKIAYQNVGGSAENANVFLEWCAEKKIDIGFIGKNRKIRTITHSFDMAWRAFQKRGE